MSGVKREDGMGGGWRGWGGGGSVFRGRLS